MSDDLISHGDAEDTEFLFLDMINMMDMMATGLRDVHAEF